MLVQCLHLVWNNIMHLCSLFRREEVKMVILWIKSCWKDCYILWVEWEVPQQQLFSYHLLELLDHCQVFSSFKVTLHKSIQLGRSVMKRHSGLYWELLLQLAVVWALQLIGIAEPTVLAWGWGVSGLKDHLLIMDDNVNSPSLLNHSYKHEVCWVPSCANILEKCMLRDIQASLLFP